MPQVIPINFIDAINQFMISLISSTGYLGIFIVMVVEGIFTPIPSETIIPFAGYLASIGRFDPFIVLLVATAGATIGSTIAYGLAWYIGRPIVTKYGKYLMFDEAKLVKAEKWFAKYGSVGIFIGHSLPGVRSIISFPAGIAKMRLRNFILFTFCGALVWNSVLLTIGYVLGEQYIEFAKQSDFLGYAFLLLLAIILIGYFVYMKYIS
ncbi:MAG TPA: DedA family protein, partial [Methanomassiliicoccales archaeon]|nr:DedA family protein [Methanomassiliicoccales archaeon]